MDYKKLLLFNLLKKNYIAYSIKLSILKKSHINMIKYLLLNPHTYDLSTTYYLQPTLTYLINKLHNLIN